MLPSMRGVRLLSSLLLSATLVACGGGGGDQPAPPVARVELSVDSILFTGKGQSQQLAPHAIDATGAQVAAAKATYVSSRPSEISVDAAGNVRAEVAVGSALITAVIDGVASRPILVMAVEMAPNARAVRDSQVVGQPTQDYSTAPGVGRLQSLTVTGIGPVSVGDILIGVESKVFAGKVVAAVASSAQIAVTLELIPLPEMFRNVSVSASLTPDQVALIASASTSTKTGASRERSMGAARIAAGPAAIKCTPSATLDVLSVNITPKVTQAVGLILDTGITDGVTKQFRLLVEGSAQADFDASVTLGTGSGEIDCRLRVDTIYFKTLAPALAAYGPAIHVDFDVRMDGSLSSNGTLAFSGTTNAVTLRAGVAYDPVNGFKDLSGIDPWSPMTTKAPSLMLVNEAARASVGLSAGLALDLVFTSELLSWVPFLDPTTLELPLIDAWAGFGFDSSWGTPSDAALDLTFKPAYQFAAKGEVGVDKDLMSNTMKFLGVTLPIGFDLSLIKSEIVLAHSPDALQITADRATFSAGDVVTFNVALDPLTSTFVGYNVSEIRIYELVGGTTAVKVASAAALDGQWSFSIPWIASHAGATTAGTQPLFHAFVVPRLFSAVATALPLELGPVADAPVVLTAPTISTPLVNISAVAGGTATFSVQASGGGVLSYKWLKGSIPAPGASNSPTYTTPTLTTADNGSSFSVFVSNAAGSATSGPVLLSVSSPLQPSPDLTVQNIGFSPAVATAGAPVQVTFTIANSGSAGAAPSTAVVRINQSSSSPAGPNLASIPITSLAAGASITTGALVAAPSSQGSYRIWVIADNSGTAGQSAGSAGNDIVLASSALTVSSAATSPDLVVSSLSFSPVSVIAGGTIQALLSVSNQGTAAAAGSTAVVRINQSTTSAAGTNLASINVPALGVGASAGLPGVLVTAPATAGTYRVWVLLDNNRTSGQSASAEANDIVLASGVLTVAAPGTADVAVSTFTFSPTTVTAGASVQIQLSVANLGQGAASASTAAIRVNQSSTSAAGAELATMAVPGIAAGSISAPLTGNISVPAVAGTYRVWAVLDINGTAGQAGAATANDAFVASTVLTVNPAQTGPRVDTFVVSPSAPSVGLPAVFTITGINLPAAPALSFPGCAGYVLNGWTSTQQQFGCTPTQSGTNMAGSILTATGSTLYAFSVSVAPLVPAPGPSGLFVGYYSEDPTARNPQSNDLPHYALLYVAVPTSGGGFSGVMDAKFLACQSGSDLGVVSGTKGTSALSGTWSGTFDLVPQSGSFSGTFNATSSSYYGDYTVAGGLQLISVPTCGFQYSVYPQGTWEVLPIGGGSPTTFRLQAAGTQVTWTAEVGTVMTMVSVIDEQDALSGIAGAAKFLSKGVQQPASFNLSSVAGLVVGRPYIVSVTTATSYSQRTGSASVRVVR